MKRMQKHVSWGVLWCLLFYFLGSSSFSHSQPLPSSEKDPVGELQKKELGGNESQEGLPSVLFKEGTGTNGNPKLVKKILLISGAAVLTGVVVYILLESVKKREHGPSVYSQGQVQISGTWGCDLDLGRETLVGDAGTDFKWNLVTAVERYISPRNGARFHVVGIVDFRLVTYSDLKSYSYSSENINGSDNESNQIPQGTVVAAITNEGRYCKFRVDTYGATLTISWVTYNIE